MASTAHHINLAKSLPPRLLRFFARYPPKAIVPPDHPANLPAGAATTTPASDPDTRLGVVSNPNFNPFKAQKHPATGKWHNPIFSLRRQAELVKLARENGVEELLPHTVKGTEERLRRRVENGTRVKGTGVGQKPKGKKRERTLNIRLEKRAQAMIEMPKIVKQWKERGHGRGWTPKPT